MRSHNRANQKQDTEVQNNPKPKFSKTQYRATISSKTATTQYYLRTPFSSDKQTPVRKTIKDQVAFHTDINGQDCNSIRPYFHTEFHQQYLTLALTNSPFSFSVTKSQRFIYDSNYTYYQNRNCFNYKNKDKNCHIGRLFPLNSVLSGLSPTWH